MTATSPERPGLAARLVLARLEYIQSGALTITDRGRALRFGETGGGLSAELRVRSQRFWGSILARGSVGAAESYIRGEWDSPDLVALVRLLVRNRAALEGVDGGLARLSRPLLLAWHALRRSSERGSRRNIAAHYDLSNDFFACFLDPTLSYSCAFFEDADSTLEQASIAKLERVCEKLGLRAGEHLLEIGTGWGALAMHAAQHHGVRVTTTTISRAQHELALDRVRAAGLGDRITVLREDYRRLTGRYDKLVSIEMVEAVGHRYFGEYFAACGRLLRPGGTFLLQAITIADQHYERARRSVDFIQRHVFPGSTIPSVTALVSRATERSDLRLVALEDITAHYVRTLAEWRRNLFANLERVRSLGFDERFVRLWEFYLCYCEGGFAERHIGDVQMLFAAPGSAQE